MIVPVQTYYIIVIIFILLIWAKPLHTRFIKKQGKKHDGMYFLCILFIPVNWYTPTIVTVTGCGKYQREVVLFPAKREGIDIGYGKNNYIFNKSDENLYFEYVYYGFAKKDENENDQIIAPGESLKVNIVSIKYLFKTPDKSVRVNSNGITYTALSCEFAKAAVEQ